LAALQKTVKMGSKRAFVAGSTNVYRWHKQEVHRLILAGQVSEVLRTFEPFPMRVIWMKLDNGAVIVIGGEN
jgi:hypothetical protein